MQLQTTTGAAGRAAVPSSSELSEGEGVAARGEGGVPAQAGKSSSSQSPTVEVYWWAGSLGESKGEMLLEQGGQCSCESWERQQQPKPRGGSIAVGRESGGKQRRDAARTGRAKFLRKLGRSAAAKALRWKYSRGQEVCTTIIVGTFRW